MKDKCLKIIILTIGVILILCSLIFNPYVIFKAPLVGKFENLLYIKIYVIFLEVLLCLIGISFLKKPERVIEKIRDIKHVSFTKREFILLLSSIAFCLVLLEFLGRILFASTNSLPLSFSSKEMIYPSLYTVTKNYTDRYTNVLLVGGSVLNTNSRTLIAPGKDKGIHFYNLAHPAHTSLDSLYKYQYLTSKKYKFDFVIFYHGINEVRTNNIQKEFFKEDYSHYYYYRWVNATFKEEQPTFNFYLSSTLIYNSYHLFCKFYGMTSFKKKAFVPFDIPAPELSQFGSEIKSEKSFRKNLMKIAEIAHAENAVLIVPIFAFHPFPPDQKMTSIWGEPKNVIKGIKRHNQVIAQIKGKYITIDTSIISNDRGNFEDICHFTSKGNKIFSDLLIQTILKM
ncbi:MAG: hypothetical protein JSW04_12655 [Desulfobacterales bacterium]|nr:MAG: hypothetical protein JSW04_12655 [Desulfobacterales bacterium]